MVHRARVRVWWGRCLRRADAAALNANIPGGLERWGAYVHVRDQRDACMQQLYSSAQARAVRHSTPTPRARIRVPAHVKPRRRQRRYVSEPHTLHGPRCMGHADISKRRVAEGQQHRCCYPSTPLRPTPPHRTAAV